MNINETAKALLPLLGGKDNIVSALRDTPAFGIG